MDVISNSTGSLVAIVLYKNSRTFNHWNVEGCSFNPNKMGKKEIKKKAIYLCEKQKEIFLLEKGEGLVYTLTNKIYINQP